jgi:chromosome segregation ATPase
LFNYVNDINSDIERLEHSISDMRNQIEKFRGQGMSTDTQRKKTLRDLDEKLKRTEIKADEYEERYQQAVRTITQLKNGIHSIFTRIGAASANVDETLGNQGVTESNMMQYLGIIEQRTTEILQAFANSQSRATKVLCNLLLLMPQMVRIRQDLHRLRLTKLVVEKNPKVEKMRDH